MLKRKLIKIDGRNIEYFEAGKGQPIVLFPGLGSSCSGWKDVIPHLAKKYKVYAFSLPFYGTHNCFGHRYTFHTFPTLIEELIKIFKIKKPILGGHSLGAVISAEYAAQHPKSVRSLLLISAPFSDHIKPIPFLWKLGVDFAMKSKKSKEIVEWLENNSEVMMLLCEILFPKRDRRRLLTAGKELFKNIPIKAMATCYHDLFNWSFRRYLEKIKIPTLFVSGTNDQPINLFNGTALYNIIPNAEIDTMHGGHFLPSDDPNGLSKIIWKFLEEKNL